MNISHVSRVTIINAFTYLKAMNDKAGKPLILNSAFSGQLYR